jgi:hypothetical protein
MKLLTFVFKKGDRIITVQHTNVNEAFKVAEALFQQQEKVAL